MIIETKQHFKKLIEIVKETEFLSALDYDYQVTRYRHSSNWLLKDVEYLKEPKCTSIIKSHVPNECKRVYESEYYFATYHGAKFNAKLVNLKLK